MNIVWTSESRLDLHRTEGSQAPSNVPYLAEDKVTIFPRGETALQIGSIGVIEFTETVDPNLLPSSTARTLPYEFYHESVSEEHKWIAFQGNLKKKELEGLPPNNPWRLESSANRTVIPADSRRALVEKTLDQAQGSVWLPKQQFEVAIPDTQDLPRSLSLQVLGNWGMCSRINPIWDCWGQISNSEEVGDLHCSLGICAINTYFKADEDDQLELVRASVDPASLVEYLLENSWDARGLWFDWGLLGIAQDMASVSQRRKTNTSRESDENLLILAGEAFDLYMDQVEEIVRRKKQLEIINGDITERELLGHQALAAARIG